MAAADPATFDDLTAAERAALADLEQLPGVGVRLRHRSRRHDPRRWATGWSTRRPGCAPGSWRSSRRGPTATATRERPRPRRAARQRDAVLAPRHRRLVGAAVLGELQAGLGAFSRSTRDTVDVPAGCSIFPKEIPRLSRRWADGGSPTSATGTSSKAAATSPPSSSRSSSSTRSGRSSGWFDDQLARRPASAGTAWIFSASRWSHRIPGGRRSLGTGSRRRP